MESLLMIGMLKIKQIIVKITIQISNQLPRL